jgi:hypothetical protein
LPRIATIPNGVDEMSDLMTQVSWMSENTAEHPTDFLGRIRKKGLDRLLNAFALTHLGKLAIGPDERNWFRG